MEITYDRPRFLSKTAAAALTAVFVAPWNLPVPLNARAQSAPTAATKPAAPGNSGPFSRRIVQAGLTIDFQVDHQNPGKHEAGEFREGDDVNVSFKIQDSATGSALTGLNPSAWMTLVRKSDLNNANACTERVQAL